MDHATDADRMTLRLKRNLRNTAMHRSLEEIILI
jgi:hypothetical protein